MKKSRLVVVLLLLGIALSSLPVAATKVVRVGPRGRTVVHRGPRGTVVVHRGFPIRRTFPHVYVRAPRVAIRVAPRVYLHPFLFPGVVVRVRPAVTAIVWHTVEPLALDDDWTDLTLDVNQEGQHLYFEVTDGAARVSFAELVYADGETQVVDFADKVYPVGFYPLVDLERARRIDHVRLVAAANAEAIGIGLHLTF